MGKPTMMNHRKTHLRLAVIAFTVGGLSGTTRAQGTPTTTPTTPTTPTPAPSPAPAEPSTGIPKDVLPDVPAGEAAPGTDTTTEEQSQGSASNLSTPAPKSAPPTPAAPPVFFPGGGAAPVRHRVKPLQYTVGLDPAAPDFGAETDLVSTANEGSANLKPKRWTFVAHGFLRAPLRVGAGPGLVTRGSTADQLHSPGYVVGSRPDDWNSVGLYPTPVGSLYLSVGNAVVSGTLVLASGTFFDSGYKQLTESGGITQGYVTMKFNEAFGERGGLAVTAGAFSNRYGLAGPRQQSSGYYNTYLFGRTHVAGAALTADLDLNEHVELILEGGGGSKLEVVPWLAAPLNAPYLPEQGPVPQGSNFVYHGHAALQVDDWLRVATHFMASYTPNDLQSSTGMINGKAQPGHLYTYGAEVHLDSLRFGNAYLGYSRVNAERALALSDGVEVLHSPNGLGLTRNYFVPGFAYPMTPNRLTPIVAGAVGDQGDIDTVLFQYMGRLASIMDLPATGRDLTFAIFGMYNHVAAPLLASKKQDKFKAGGEVQFAALRNLSVGLRFDRVMPNGGRAEVAYSAISPRLVFHSTWLSREYLLLSYTRYFLGSAVPNIVSPYYPFDNPSPENTYAPDENLLVLSALIAF